MQRRLYMLLIGVFITFLFGTFQLSALDNPEVDTRIQGLQGAVPTGTPSISGYDQKGYVGSIISNMFDATQKIKSYFVLAFRDILGATNNNNVPKWNGQIFQVGTIWDVGGNIGVGTSTISSGLKLDVAGKLGATEYCDEDGNNCFLPSDVGSGSTTLEAAWYPTCPVGWIDTNLTDCDGGDGHGVQEDSCGGGGGAQRLCLRTLGGGGGSSLSFQVGAYQNRSFNTNYTSTNGGAIILRDDAEGTANCTYIVKIDGNEITRVKAKDWIDAGLSVVIPNGSDYRVEQSGSACAGSWLRYADFSGGGSGGGADNLGNHIAIQNIVLNNNWLSNDGGNEGISILDDGKVGIGLDTPQTQLHIMNTARFDGGIQVDGVRAISNTNASHKAQFTDDTHYGFFEVTNSSGVRGAYLGYGNGGNRVNLHLDNADRLNISGGNVGIGVADPLVKLHVNGNIIANDPTADNHVATKAYVDSVGGAGGGSPMGQWQDVTASRSKMTAYQNTNSSGLLVNITSSKGGPIEVSVDGTTWMEVGRSIDTSSDSTTTSIVVPPNHYYRVGSNNPSISTWAELVLGNAVGGTGDNLGDHRATRNIDMGNWKIVNLDHPTQVQDAATKGYVDSMKPPVCNGVNKSLGWDGTNWVCNDISSGSGANCALPWGGYAAHGQSVVAYSNSYIFDWDGTCNDISEYRVCNNGVLSGGFNFQTCSIRSPGP